MNLYSKNISYESTQLDDCSINVRQNLDGNGPIPVSLIKNAIVSPDHTGNVRLAVGQSIELFCSGDQVNIAQCIRNDRFAVIGGHGESQIDTIKCAGPVKAQVTATQIESEISNIQIGYQLSHHKEFVKMIELYVNTVQLRPIYEHHRVGPGVTHGYNPVSVQGSPSFRRDNLFPADTNNRYTKAQQRITICDELLHITEADCSTYFDAKEHYLARGHLAPSGDFEYRSGYLASYSYANVAPQWQAINNGHWKAVEENVRRFANQSALQLDVVTGTLGTMRLNNRHGVPTELSLDANGQFPVPEVFYKIVVDQEVRRGIVIIVLNNPFAREAEVERQVCPDRSDRVEWIGLLFEGSGKKRRRTSRRADAFVAKGFLYTCEIGDFLTATGVVAPEFLTENEYKLLIK